MRLLIDMTDEALADILQIATYISQDNVSAASRFIPAVNLTLEGLAEFPGKGSPKDMFVPRLAGLRSYAVDGFPNHLIFYRALSGKILHELAVLYGGRDWPRLLRERS